MNTKKIRVVDNDVYLPVLRELVESGKEVSLTVTGNSMSPFLKDKRDTVMISPIKGDLRRGDIAFFQRESGQYVLHRIYKVNNEGFFFNGDAQCWTEGPIARERIFGVVNSACRKGKWIKKGQPVWRFFAHVWLWLLPVRGVIKKIYVMFCRCNTY